MNKPSARERHRAMVERERRSYTGRVHIEAVALYGGGCALGVLYVCYEMFTEGPSLFGIVSLLIVVPFVFILFRLPWREAKRVRRLKNSLKAAKERRRARLAKKR